MQRDALRIEGPEAEKFLQGQLSQDVARLAVGDAAFTFVLEPQGKVVVWGRISRLGDAAFELDVDRGYGERALTRLNRFKLRTKADLTLAESVERPELDWPGLEPGDGGDYERRRITAGVPALGRELDEHTIPAEAGAAVIQRSVSFTKGCYTGQELVARVDSRGSNTPRKLRRLSIESGIVEAGASLSVGGREVGRLTSVAAAGAGAVALAYVKRDAPAEAFDAQVDGLAARVEPE